MRKRFFIRPMEHALSSDYPSLHLPYSMADWPTKNVKVDQHSIKGRWGYDYYDRDLGSGVNIQSIIIYQLKNGSRYTMYLTDTDLCLKETSSGKTWSYKTDTYTTGTISSISGTTVTGSGTDWVTEGIAAGDKFIMNSDHTSDEEEDASWGTVASVTDATHLELSASYTKNGTGYKLRKVYSTPSNERWTYAMVNDTLCFTNGNTNVQVWNGSDYATDLNTTNAIKARYCIEYANRLIIADCETTRDPLMFKWSANNDPTDWTSSDAGQKQFLETTDYITGLGKVGTYLAVYKRDSIMFGSQTGNATSPFIFPTHRQGVGCIAPYSILHFMGTNAFLGRENFYFINGDQPVPVGGKLKDKFFEIVSATEAENTWGFVNSIEHELIWVAETSEGQFAFVIDYETGEQTVYEFADSISGGGRGAI